MLLPPPAGAAKIAILIATLILCRQAFAQAEAHKGHSPALQEDLSTGTILTRAAGRDAEKGQPDNLAPHAALRPAADGFLFDTTPSRRNPALGKTAAFTHVSPAEFPKRMPEKIRYAEPVACQGGPASLSPIPAFSSAPSGHMGPHGSGPIHASRPAPPHPRPSPPPAPRIPVRPRSSPAPSRRGGTSPAVDRAAIPVPGTSCRSGPLVRR